MADKIQEGTQISADELGKPTGEDAIQGGQVLQGATTVSSAYGATQPTYVLNTNQQQGLAPNAVDAYGTNAAYIKPELPMMGPIDNGHANQCYCTIL